MDLHKMINIRKQKHSLFKESLFQQAREELVSVCIDRSITDLLCANLGFVDLIFLHDSITKKALSRLKILSPMVWLNRCHTKVYQVLATKLKLIVVICVDRPTTHGISSYSIIMIRIINLKFMYFSLVLIYLVFTFIIFSIKHPNFKVSVGRSTSTLCKNQEIIYVEIFTLTPQIMSK